VAMSDHVWMVVGKSERLKEMVLEEEWIGRTRRMYEEDMTNGLAVWDLIIRRVCELEGRD
jgi:hypothetical protein